MLVGDGIIMYISCIGCFYCFIGKQGVDHNFWDSGLKRTAYIATVMVMNNSLGRRLGLCLNKCVCAYVDEYILCTQS